MKARASGLDPHFPSDLACLLGLSDLATAALAGARTGANRVHQVAGLFRQAVHGRLAGDEDGNDAGRLPTQAPTAVIARSEGHALAASGPKPCQKTLPTGA